VSEQVSRIVVSRVVHAPQGRIFAFLVNPENHRCFDTSGMVRGSADHTVPGGVGAVFVMDMHNEFKGDHRVENHVVVFERDRAIGWAPAERGQEPAGHTFVWRLSPVDDDRTLVSQIYDWSAFAHREMLSHLPVVDRDQLRASLDRLADAVTETT
jgi:uncharacterized protein YndB with AHSA1/START domain